MRKLLKKIFHPISNLNLMRPELFIQKFPPEIESSLLPATQKGLLKEGSNPSFEALLLVGLLFKQMSAFYSFYISVDVPASTGFLPFFFWVGKHTWSFITISCWISPTQQSIS